MKFNAHFVEKPCNFQMDDCQIEKVVELSHEDFCRLKTTPLTDQPFITENKDCMFHRDGVIHCLLALDQGGSDGILVDAEGYDYARLAAYVPGMRAIVNAELDRAADLIVRQCIENTREGNWCASFNGRPGHAHGYLPFDELEETFGLVIREGNGLDSMLTDILHRYPEVTSVELNDGIVETVCDLSFLKQQSMRKTTPAQFQTKRAAELLENAISTALELYQGEDQYTMLHGSFGLTIREIREHGYLSDQELTDICRVPQEVLEGGMTVRDVLALDGLPEGTSLAHRNSVFPVPVEDLKLLTDAGREDFSALLDARVSDVRVDEGTPELVLEGVEASELERLHEELEANQHAEETMGPVM